jgi:hypothetical protein
MLLFKYNNKSYERLFQQIVFGGYMSSLSTSAEICTMFFLANIAS